MHWFGLDWWDLLINVIALAIIPGLLAAGGGHLAAEAILDKTRIPRVKAIFWLLFACGVVITSWQQFRIAQADFARETKETWNQAIVTRLLFHPAPPPDIAYVKTPKPNADKRLYAVTFHPEQQSTGANSPNQTMIGSPGGIQAGRDVNITSDKRIVQSIAMRVYIETDTQPSKTTGPSDADTSAGLQSAVALFTANKERIRFVSDWTVKDRQISATRRRLSFTYAP